MTVSKDCAESRETFSIPRCSSVRGVSPISSIMPSTPLMGVRISWLIMARKADLARVARSAVSTASRKSSWVFTRAWMMGGLNGLWM